MVEQLESQRTQKIFFPFLWGAKYRRNEAEKTLPQKIYQKAIIVAFDLEVSNLSPQLHVEEPQQTIS